MPKKYRDLVGDAGSDIVAQVVGQRQRVRSRMEKVAHTVAVMSGKGGVGKSMLTANLATALAARGYAVGALDADLSGPCLARMLGAQGQSLRTGGEGVSPAVGVAGVRVMSVDFLLAGDETPVVWDNLSGSAQDAFVWRGTMDSSALREFLSDTDWGELDCLFIDLPPGSHPFPTLVQLLPDLDGTIVVTIPSDISRLVVKKSVTLARESKTPLLGLVENMAGYHCLHCGVVGELFPSSAGGSATAEDLSIPYLGQVPFDPRLCESTEGGLPFVLEHGDSPAGKALIEIANRIEQSLGVS
jgi:ATP-binding protein involved in chromosome partitioning